MYGLVQELQIGSPRANSAKEIFFWLIAYIMFIKIKKLNQNIHISSVSWKKHLATLKLHSCMGAIGQS